DHAGATLGPLLAAALVTVAGFSPGRVIAWSVLPGVLAAGLAWVALRGMASSRVQDPPGGAPVPRAAAAPPAAGTSPPVVALVVLFALVRMPETLFLLRLQDLGLAIGVVPLLWASLHVVRTAASYPGGWVTDRSGPLRTMLAGWLLYAVVCAGLAQAGTPGQGIAWFLALGLVAGATESSERTFIAQLGGPARRGRAFGAYHATVGLAALPGGILLGLVYARWAGPAALRVSAAATAAIAVLGLLVARRRAPG
ncbi:MAG TPA: MFS transporter, partial [Gemmatimonadales bacterium]|nr:MFS transporter [Gemmatimonadales bacterium]